MVIDPANYLWSSYRAHAFGINVKMWTPHPEYLALGSTKASRMAAYRRLFDAQLEKDTISEIRHKNIDFTLTPNIIDIIT